MVILDGRVKPNQTVLSDREYEKIRALGATVDRDPPPFASADDFARESLAGRD